MGGSTSSLVRTGASRSGLQEMATSLSTTSNPKSNSASRCRASLAYNFYGSHEVKGGTGSKEPFRYCNLDSEKVSPFTAVSYSWDSSLKQLSPHVRNSHDDRAILLPVSLWLAPVRLRRPDECVRVWADDVMCINQNCQ
jgi:hypothetical protein